MINGSDITVFRHEDETKNSISDNDITAITSDNTGMIWIGTRHGLNSLNPFTGVFTTYHPPVNGLGNEEFIQSVASDKSGRIYMGTFAGLFVYEPGEKQIIPVEINGLRSEKMENNRITDLAVDHNNILWLTTFNGLWSYNPLTHEMIHEISKENDSLFTPLFTCLVVDHSGKIWSGTWDKGLKEFDPITKKINTHKFNQPANIFSIAEIKQTDGYTFWVNGITAGFDETQQKWTHFPPSDGLPSSIDDLYTSRDNWLWIGTHDGLYFYNPSKNLFKQHRFSKSITGQEVSLLEWNDKILVAGSDKNFLKTYDEDLNVKDDYSKQINNDDLSCLSLQWKTKNELIAGTSSGIADINLITHKIKLNHLDSLAKDYSSGNFITDLFYDKNHSLWLFPWRNGIWIADSTFKKIHQVFNNFLEENGHAKPLVISAAVEDKNHNLWFADVDEGIIFYNRLADKFSKPFVKELGEKNSADQLIYYHNDCYSFSGNVVLKWNPDSFNLQKIKLPPQMDKDISSIAVDSIAHLWIATQKGLFVYNLKTKEYGHFTYADGLITNDMDGTLYCLKNGTMIFGSPDYLTSFEPSKMLSAIDEVPSLKLTEILAEGQPIIFDTTRKMIFNHDVNNFIFKWAVTDFNNPLNNHYYYQLKGIDKDWHYAGNHGEAEFANLSPGNYTLFLKGENTNGVNADKILHLNFEIKFPFWRTWWFLSLLFLATCAFFYSLYRYRLQQILGMEKLRNRISLDLHDDIGSTLSSISILSEMALHPKKDSNTEEMLNEIKDNSLSLMERMDDIVWSINPRNDSMENLFLRIKTFAAKLFEAKEINYKIDIDEKTRHIHLPMEYRQHIYLIMKEAINNLVKYANATKAEINVTCHASQLHIMVKDNGRGFDTHQKYSGNGMTNMKKRATEIKAIVEIESKINEGTEVSLAVKIK